MPITNTVRDNLDLPRWRSCAPGRTATAAGASVACDLRNNEDRHPELFSLTSATSFWRYNTKNNEWSVITSPALAGTFGAGACAVLHPGQGPRGLTAAGGTTTSVILQTPLPAAVGINQLANRGDGRGFKIRLMNPTAMGGIPPGGLTEERIIIGNTAGTMPTIYLDSPLSFAPGLNDTYEILSGKVYLLSAGTLASGIFKAYDIATNSYATLAQANLPASITTDTCLEAFCELYVPYDKNPSEGFFGVLTSTATGATTLTGQTAGGDAGVFLNEYRNFQIRIISDFNNPASVGQRRRIISHTAGASPVYTVAAWTNVPSAGATYVIEVDNDKIVGWSSGGLPTYNYNITANTWDTTTWAARPTACGAGVMSFPSWGIVPATTISGTRPQRHSYIYTARGAAQPDINLFDIAGAATGLFSAAVTYGGSGSTFTTGSNAVRDYATNEGRYAYISFNGTTRFMRFDVYNLCLEPWNYLSDVQGATHVGEAMATALHIDGSDKLQTIITLQRTGSKVWAATVLR